MTNGRLKLSGKLHLKADANQLLVKDIVRHLSGLAKLYEEGKTGNPELGKGLRQVAHVLRPFADYPVTELTDIIARKEMPFLADSRAPSRGPKLVLPTELEALSQDDIERILNDDRYTKQQIAELGFRRFGISRSKLESLRKEDARASVRAALNHEKSLDVIAREARKAGKARVG